MPRHVALRSFTVVVCSIAILCSSVAARAQDVDAGFNPGANQTIEAIALQPDGKIIVAGNFTGLGNGTGTVLRNHIGRLNADGTVDLTFNGGANGTVHAVAVQPDGKIVVGGNFSTLGVGAGIMTRNYIGRLNADGSVDTSLNPGTNNNVYALAVQPDGKILVGGAFTVMGGGTPQTPRIGLARLNPNGSPDTFNPGVSKIFGAPIVYALALQTDGKVVVGGYFNGLGGGTGTSVRNFIGRVHADGSIDAGFNPGANSITGVNALAQQADGKILVGGTFNGLGNATGTVLRQNIGRLNVDGTVDVGFNPGAEAQVLTLGVQADGKILAGGYFKWVGAAGGPTRSERFYIARLLASGAVDGTFNPGADNVVNGVAIQPDGAILAVGLFSKVGGGGGPVNSTTVRQRIARFPTTNEAVQTLTLINNNVVSWMRSGAGPEVSHVTFEQTTGGLVYTMLGNGVRVAGGWELGGLDVPNDPTVNIRARGYYGTGYQNGSGSIVEAFLSPVRLHATAGDFDGDAKADVSVYRPSTGTWWMLQSTSGVVASPFGVGTDTIVPGDYDGDLKADLAVFRPSTATWYINRSTAGILIQAWGLSTDIPVQADYDGDGKTDIAVFRNGTWYILKSSDATFTASAWGLSTDIPVPSDYDGDGKTDVAIFRPSTATWYINRSTAGVLIQAWGLSTDIPVQADYDGDGKTDIAVFRNGTWYILKSSDATFTAIAWGLSTDTPVPGDYDGDRKADVAVFRPSTSTWYLQQSTSGFVSTTWGLSTDTAVLKRPRP